MIRHLFSQSTLIAVAIRSVQPGKAGPYPFTTKASCIRPTKFISAVRNSFKMNKELPRQFQHNHKKQEQCNGNGPTFPHKLYMMLESIESLGLSHIVTWLPDGGSFQIVDPDEFVHLVLPYFFKATKFRSFTRQLNLWDFERMPTMRGRGNHWYHESFIRGRPEILSGIIRTKIKGRVNITRHVRTPLKQQTKTKSVDIDHKATLPEDSVYTVRPGRHTTTTTAAATIDQEFDMLMKELFSSYGEPHQIEGRVSFDGSYNTNADLNETLTLPFLPASIGIAESRYVTQVKSRTELSSHWNSLIDEMEPLPIDSVNQLRLDSQDDFQVFLRGLIK